MTGFVPISTQIGALCGRVRNTPIESYRSKAPDEVTERWQAIDADGRAHIGTSAHPYRAPSGMSTVTQRVSSPRRDPS
jgi:hypothetical protein